MSSSRKKATKNDLMQLKHLPSKIKSSYGTIVYLANKIPIHFLIYTLLYLINHYFGLRSFQEHHDMFVEDFSLKRTTEAQRTQHSKKTQQKLTKTRQGELRKKRSAIQPKISAFGGTFFSSSVLRNISCPQTLRNAKEWSILSRHY